MLDDDPIEEAPEGVDHVADAVAAVEATLSAAPAEIRNSPEYKALAKQARQSAREAGSAKAREAAMRTQAAEAQQAAEAERQAALESQLQTVLGAEGIALYQEIAELGETDPVAAARKFAELMTMAQSRSEGGPTETPPTAPEGNVPAQTPPPFPTGGVDGNAPLAPREGEDIAALTASLDARYAEVVARNQDPVTRNRVTMRERSAGFIAYVASAYVKATGRT